MRLFPDFLSVNSTANNAAEIKQQSQTNPSASDSETKDTAISIFNDKAYANKFTNSLETLLYDDLKSHFEVPRSTNYPDVTEMYVQQLQDFSTTSAKDISGTGDDAAREKALQTAEKELNTSVKNDITDADKKAKSELLKWVEAQDETTDESEISPEKLLAQGNSMLNNGDIEGLKNLINCHVSSSNEGIKGTVKTFKKWLENMNLSLGEDGFGNTALTCTFNNTTIGVSGGTSTTYTGNAGGNFKAKYIGFTGSLRF